MQGAARHVHNMIYLVYLYCWTLTLLLLIDSTWGLTTPKLSFSFDRYISGFLQRVDSRYANICKLRDTLSTRMFKVTYVSGEGHGWMGRSGDVVSKG